MMKWIAYAILATVIVFSWRSYQAGNAEIAQLTQQVNGANDMGENEKVERLQKELDTAQNAHTIQSFVLFVTAAVLVGLIVVFSVLPAVAHRMTHAIYDSGQEVERDPMHDARSLIAQGEYEGAIEALKLAAAADPMNRVPWVEMVKIYKDHLDRPDQAIETLRYALESQAWEVNDAAYFMFRLAELYDTIQNDRASAIAIMNQVANQFKGTRHSANAVHKLHEWQAEHVQTDDIAVIERTPSGPNPPLPPRVDG